MTILAVAHERVFLTAEYNIDVPPPSLAESTSRTALQMDEADGAYLDFVSQTGDVWLHYKSRDWDGASYSGSAFGSGFVDGANARVVGISSYFDGALKLRIVAEATNYDTGVEFDGGNTHVIDLKANVTTGAVDLYVDGILEWSNTVTFTKTEIARAVVSGSDPNDHVSDIIVATTSTVGWYLAHKAPTSVGNYTGQASGVFSDIDDLDQDNAAKMIISTDGNRASFATNSPPAPSGGEEIKGLAIAWYAQRTASGPNTLTPFVRSASTDTDGPDVALDAAWATGQAVFSVTDKDAEIGLKASVV